MRVDEESSSTMSKGVEYIRFLSQCTHLESGVMQSLSQSTYGIEQLRRFVRCFIFHFYTVVYVESHHISLQRPFSSQTDLLKG